MRTAINKYKNGNTLECNKNNDKNYDKLKYNKMHGNNNNYK